VRGGGGELAYDYIRKKTIQGVTKRCRLSWLTNSSLVYEPIITLKIISFRSGSYDNIPPADLLAGAPEAAVVSPRGSLASAQLEGGSSSGGGGYELVNFSRGTTAAALKKNSYDYAAQQNAVGRPEDNQSGT
jgi:hypothetical protein